MHSGRLWFGILTLILLINVQAFSQKESRKKRDKKSVAADTIQVQSAIDVVLEFPNINKVPYYYNEKALDKITQYQAAENWQELYPALAEYIYQFGIQNFYKDTELLWQFAKLTELYGSARDARLLYKLVLKHHREDIDLTELEVFYDSLNRSNLAQYVPIDYYYDLVDYRREVDTLAPPRNWKINMGHYINSEFSDYGPALSADGNTLIFTSKRHVVPKGIDNIQNEDLFFSTAHNEIWEPAAPLKEINTAYNEGSACLSKDGKTMYFVRCDAPDTYGNCDLFVAEMQEDSVWGTARNLGPSINSGAWDSHPSLSQHDDTLYFASDRIGGFGLADIYYTSKDAKGQWLPARNLGPIINSRGNDVSPFMHPQQQVLYFSSNGHLLNFGDFDIYKSTKGRRWSEPKNIGPLVNTAGGEFYFTIDGASRNLYYARSIENDLQNLDLYSFPLPMEAQPLANTLLTGSVRDEQGNPFQRGIVSIIDMDNGIEVAPKYLNNEGSFEFDLINNTEYLLVVQGEEFFRIEEIFFLDGDTNLDLVTQSITSRLKFASIEFDEASAELKTTMYRDLDRVANFLLDNRDFKVRISGHTDSDGSADFNMQLSQQRAQAIADYLIYFGRIAAARIEVYGLGSTQPIVEEKTEADKALNRRVEFELFRPSKEELDKMQQEIKEENNDGW
jgi:outer membrane protein OmpA-like peptidoglycan-associated protein